MHTNAHTNPLTDPNQTKPNHTNVDEEHMSFVVRLLLVRLVGDAWRCTSIDPQRTG